MFLFIAFVLHLEDMYTFDYPLEVELAPVFDVEDVQVPEEGALLGNAMSIEKAFVSVRE